MNSEQIYQVAKKIVQQYENEGDVSVIEKSLPVKYKVKCIKKSPENAKITVGKKYELLENIGCVVKIINDIGRCKYYKSNKFQLVSK